MEILRKGKEVSSYVFSCERCGCIWKAKAGEYVEIRGYDEGMFVPLYRGYLMSIVNVLIVGKKQ